MGIWPFDKTLVKFSKKSRKSDCFNPSSWRSFSLTSHSGNVFERVIDRRLRSTNILDIDQQHFGFQPGKSTLHYLHNLYHDILAMKNLPIATVFDIVKAFNSVDQTLFLSKLINIGSNWSNVSCYKIFFFTNRKVSIQVNDYIDMSFVPLNGLPQGAVLSTLLFMFYKKGFLQDADLPYKNADDSTSLSSKEN